MEFTVRSMTRLEGGKVKAVAEVDYAGLRLRGLKLEEREGRLDLTMPGRRVAGKWQLVFEVQAGELHRRLHEVLTREYQTGRAA
ncbi:MAG: hypothetical protein AB1758_14940 [Candidatus Eremiobacterota bacterium]